MTIKKLLVIVGGVLMGIILLIALFVGMIAGMAFYFVGNSEAAEAAKTFLRSNQKLKSDIGNVRDFGWFVTGGVDVNSADGDATINLKVIGERRDINASVNLVYKHGHGWRVTGATYQNSAGQAVELLDKYEAETSEPVEESNGSSDE